MGSGINASAFMSGFMTGYDTVDKWQTNKAKKEAATKEAAQRNIKAKQDLDNLILTKNIELSNRLSAKAKERSKVGDEGNTKRYNELNAEIASTVDMYGRYIDKANQTNGTNFQLPDGAMQSLAENVEIISYGKKNNEQNYVGSQAIAEDIRDGDIRDEDIFEGDDGHLRLKERDANGEETENSSIIMRRYTSETKAKEGYVWAVNPATKKSERVTNEFADSKGWEQARNREESTDYASIDGVTGYYTREELSGATKKGKQVEKKYAPTGTSKNIVAIDGVKRNLKSVLAKDGVEFDSFENISFSNMSKEQIRKTKEAGVKIARLRLGGAAPELLSDAQGAMNNVDRLSSAIKTLEGADKSDDINFLKKMYRSKIGKYFGDIDDAGLELLAADKEISEVNNNIRHELFGAVLTAGENRNFYDQAATIYESNKSMLVGLNSTVESQIGELKKIRIAMGKDLFRSQFGERLEALEDRNADMKEIMSGGKRETSNQIDVGGVSYESRTIGGKRQIQDPKTKKWFYY